MRVPTWLGLSRDMRLFEVVYYDELGGGVEIMPRFHGDKLTLAETAGKEVRHAFCMGRGIGCVSQTTRRLEDGYLPILHSTTRDEDVVYSLTAFASLERSALTAATLRGTHFLVADGHGVGHMFTEAQQGEFDRLRGAEEQREEEVVLCVRAEAVNAGAVPRYAWFKSVRPNVWPEPEGGVGVDGATGFSRLGASGPVFCVTRLNGAPMPQSEVALLLQPGEKAVVEFFLPHQPLPTERAAALAEADFDKRHAECRAFWLKKLDSGAHISVPEPVVDEMVKAGLLHLRPGRLRAGAGRPVAPTIGVYSPIGSESSPIIQFFDSMGWHDLARARARLLPGQAARRRLHPELRRLHARDRPGALDHGRALPLHARRRVGARDQGPSCSRRATTCSPGASGTSARSCAAAATACWTARWPTREDSFHSFMLNGFAYLGMQPRRRRCSAQVDPAESRRLARRGGGVPRRTSARRSTRRWPARRSIPLGDGTWVPVACRRGPEYRGPRGALRRAGQLVHARRVRRATR